MKSAVVNHREAWSRLKLIYPDDTWFGGTHLEENKPRLMRMLGDIAVWHPPGSRARVMDVGCFNGFMPYLLGQLGYETAGIDALSLKQVPERTRIMGEANAPFYEANFNRLDPFDAIPKGTYDVAILGEVIEHILNHPVGLVRSIGGLLKPGGRLILTTPNPSTLGNSLRVLRGQPISWAMPSLPPCRSWMAEAGSFRTRGSTTGNMHLKTCFN